MAMSFHPEPQPNPFRRQTVDATLPSTEEREERWVEYQVAENRFERYCLFLEPAPKPEDIERKAADLRKKFPDFAKNELEFFSGAAWHDRSNAYESAFFGWMEVRLKAQGRQMKDLTPEEIQDMYMEFPDKADLEQSEDRAIKRYQDASESFWKTARFELVDAQAHRIGLEDRAARFRLRGTESVRRQEELLTDFARMIDALRDSGQKSEFEVVYLLRRWSQEKGLSHLISVELGLPREDMGDKKTDIRLTVAGIVYPLQLKTEVMSDAYRMEHYQPVRAKAAAAIQGTETRLATVDTMSLTEAYRKWGRAETRQERMAATRAKHAVLDALIELLPPESAELLSALTERKPTKPKSPEQGKRLSRDFLIRSANIPLLIRLGALSSVEAMNPSAIMRAKEVLAGHLPAISKIVGSQEVFQAMDDEMTKKIAATLRQGNG